MGSNSQWKFLKDVAKLIEYADSLGYKLTGGELHRPDFVQAKYVKEGKSQVAISNHQKRQAIDLNLFVDGNIKWNKCNEWIILGDYWKSLNKRNRWGGDYKTLLDPYHFETV